MIAKMVKGRGFRGAVEYDLKKGYVIETNMAGINPREFAAEFGAVRRLRPNLGKAVMHVSLAASPGEKLTDGDWREIGKRYLKHMGFNDNQYIITRHTDTDHEHIHILANRITHAGGVVSDAHDWKRQETIMRNFEKDYGLTAVAPSHEAERRAATKGEIEHHVRTGQPSIRQQLQHLCDAAAKTCRNYTEYQKFLGKAGVELIPVAQLEGEKLSGLSYRLNGVTMKGSDLGKLYTASGIQKRGIEYDKNRDFEAVCRNRERETNREFGITDGSGSPSRASERGGTSGDFATVGAVDGRADRRDSRNIRGTEQDIGRSRQAIQTSRRDAEQDHNAGRADWRTDVQSQRLDREKTGLERETQRRSSRNDYSNAADAINSLASTAAACRRKDHLSDGRTDSRDSQPTTREITERDRTTEAIHRQITALDQYRYQIGIRDEKTGKMMERKWTPNEITAAIPWLKRMNAKGNHIYIRPNNTTEHGLVLLDDIKPDTIKQMKADGFEPAAVIETSPGNYQVWIKLRNYGVDTDTRQIAAQKLAKRYGCDPNSADGQHYGRLAGFTNPKQKHTRNGLQPYVLAHDCPGHVATAGRDYAESIKKALDKEAADKARQERLDAIKAAQVQTTTQQHLDAVNEYRRQAKRLLKRYGKDANLSKLDWMIASDMAKSGHYSASDIARAIKEASPNIEQRKVGHIEDYTILTATKATNRAAKDYAINLVEKASREKALLVDHITRITGAADAWKTAPLPAPEALLQAKRTHNVVMSNSTPPSVSKSTPPPEKKIDSGFGFGM
jgi:hypothetical protein